MAPETEPGPVWDPKLRRMQMTPQSRQDPPKDADGPKLVSILERFVSILGRRLTAA